ncbi:MAG: DUF3784 domain-containing protein [Coriobacteriales bacterium]|nr:DUF3784 domain-containing protein [Coriobacteriales bacterium]
MWIFVVVFAALLIVLGIALLFGKGAWLIAGYNTASKEEKARIDTEKLCRSMGVLLLVVSAATVLMAYGIHQAEIGVLSEDEVLPYVAPLFVVTVIGVFAEMRYIRRHCQK